MSALWPYRREITFRPGYNKRGTQYGVHGMEIHFRFFGPRGVTQFTMGTGWVPGEITRRNALGSRIADMYPMANDLGYHWPTPQYDGQEDWVRTDCPFLPHGVCFYDGSGLNAQPVMEAFVERGEPAVWRALVAYYRRLCEDDDARKLASR